MKRNVSKTLLVVFISALVFSGCSLLFSSPSSVVKQLMADAENGNVDGMVNAWSRKGIEEQGADRLRENAQQFAANIMKARERGENLKIENLRESVQGDRARVFYVYRDLKANDSVGMAFAMVKEDGKWKFYRAIDIGEESKAFDSSFAPANKPVAAISPDPITTPVETLTAPPPPSTSGQKNSNSNSAANTVETKSGPVSAGSLNSKATSLPAPTYPPAAKAVKAGGTVVVKVLVDENGDVMTADAVSGHPLLRSAAEQAARIAHFSPTMENGKRVKTTGTISYQFTP